MGRPRSHKREEAFKLYKESKAKIPIKEIALKLETNIKTVYSWKLLDEWDKEIFGFSDKVGAPKGNQNAKAISIYDKQQPKAMKKIVDRIRDSGISLTEIAYEEIIQQWALIVCNSSMLYVKDQEDHTQVVIAEQSSKNSESKEYEVMTAYEKQLKMTREMSNARKVLYELIKSFQNLYNKNWDIANEEERIKLEKHKAEVNIINNKLQEDKNKDKAPAMITFRKASEINGEK